MIENYNKLDCTSKEPIVKVLTDEEYNKRMNELGFVEEPEFGKFFLGDKALLMNLSDEVNSLSDLIQISGNHPTYMSKALMDFSMSGAELAIGPGAIDEYGIRHNKALYCTNYKELYSNNANNEKHSKGV